MGKTKTSLSLSAIDLKKPLVKDFVDPDKAIEDFVLNRLPEFPRTRIKLCLTYQSKDKTLYRFRVNWINSEGRIVNSKCYEVNVGETTELTEKL
jgi:hypothetical protein